MTVTSSTTRVTYAGNGETAAFAVPFPFLAESHLTVVHRDATGSETQWTEGVQYTVGGAGEATGGTVTVAVDPTDYRPQTGETLTILRVVPLTQEIDFTEGDPLPAQTLEGGFDKAVMVDQQQAEELARAVKLAKTSPLSGLELPEPEPSTLLAWNADGTGLINAVPVDLDMAAVSTFMQTLLGAGDAQAARATLGALSATDDGSSLAGIGQAGADRLAPHEALVVKSVTDATVDIDAGAVVVRDAGGRRVRLEAVDLTVDIEVSGANGLDTGAEGNARWHAAWVIWNGTTAAGLLSESFTAPTLPGGYGYKGLVGAVYNDGAGDFVEFIQLGDFVGMSTPGVLADGTATSFTTVNLAAAVPPNARSVVLNGYVRTFSGTANVNAVVAAGGDGITQKYVASSIYKESTSTIGFTGSFPEIPFLTSQEIAYRVSGANAQLTLGVVTFRY